MGADKSAVLVGRVSSPFGIKGWVKISSYTQPLENILDYGPWQLRNSNSGEAVRVVELQEGKAHGKGLVAKLPGVDNRDQAELLKGLEILVAREQLPEIEEGRYYWADLEGLQVETVDGKSLGWVDHMMEAGAADVMVVCGEDKDKKRCLIPFIRDEVIRNVDLKAGVIRVDWEDDAGNGSKPQC
jgi:16S rRNA processing protein RimM